MPTPFPWGTSATLPQADQQEITQLAQENLELLAQAVRGTAASYEDTDAASSEEFTRIEDQF